MVGGRPGRPVLGHVAAGTFADVNEAASVVRTKPEVTEPDPRTTETYDALHGIYRSVYASLREDMHRLAELAGP
jgi:xylulokinase